uniref:Uncharacterized protein n=1 Tax=uncultured Desulfobacterium sp. TaxID=201089 RepID=E1YKG2_9BACT|nr:unknown protein [uncultured Desulfobacterium sp.]
MNRKNYNKSMNPTPSKLRFLSLAGGGVGYFRRYVRKNIYIAVYLKHQIKAYLKILSINTII